MIRLGNRIKLTKKEQQNFMATARTNIIPQTVEEYNNLLEADAFFWENLEDSAEAKLLSAFARFSKIEVDRN